MFGEGAHIMWDVVGGAAVYVVVFALLAARATRDTNRRGLPGWLFGALVAFVPPVGLIAWGIVVTLVPIAQPWETRAG